MLRQVYIIINDYVVYERTYGKGIDKNAFLDIYTDLKVNLFSKSPNEIVSYQYYNVILESQ